MFKRGKYQVSVESTFILNSGPQYEVVYWLWGLIPVTIAVRNRRTKANKTRDAVRKLKGLK